MSVSPEWQRAQFLGLGPSPEPQVRIMTAARLRAGGTTPAQVRTRIRQGEMVAIARGVYVPREVARAFDPVPNGGHVLRAAGSIVLAGPGTRPSERRVTK